MRNSTDLCEYCIWVTLFSHKHWTDAEQAMEIWKANNSKSVELLLPQVNVSSVTRMNKWFFDLLLTLGSYRLSRSVWWNSSFRSVTSCTASSRFGEDSQPGDGTQEFLCLGSKQLLQTFWIWTHNEEDQYTIVRRTVRVTSSVVCQLYSCIYYHFLAETEKLDQLDYGRNLLCFFF